MLFSQNLITKNNVSSYNSAVQSINNIQRAEKQELEREVAENEKLMSSLNSRISDIKKVLSYVDLNLLMVEKMLEAW